MLLMYLSLELDTARRTQGKPLRSLYSRKDQSRNLRATSNQENVSYSWLRNGQPLSETGKELSVSRAGTYRVIVTNEGGCTASAEVIIRESQTELPIDITAPSSQT